MQAAHRSSWCFVCVVRGWHRRSCASGDREVHTAAPKVRPHARACAHTRPRHRRGVGERPHVRWSVERTASLAVAKPRCSGGQTRWTCELSGLCKVYNPKRWPAEGAVLFRPIMWLCSASVVLVWDSFLLCTLLWPYSSKVHLVLATALLFLTFFSSAHTTQAQTKLPKPQVSYVPQAQDNSIQSALHRAAEFIQ